MDAYRIDDEEDKYEKVAIEDEQYNTGTIRVLII